MGKFCGGRCNDWLSNADGTLVTESLYDRLEEEDFKPLCKSTTVKFSIEENSGRWVSSRMFSWLVVIRTETDAEAHTLKSQVEGTDFCAALRDAVPIRTLLG